LASKGDLVDMEGAAVARVADLFGTPWTLIKAVTDNAGPTGRNTLLSNLSAVSSELARFLWSQMTVPGQTR
jgi:nucleoside phosphorylase